MPILRPCPRCGARIDPSAPCPHCATRERRGRPCVACGATTTIGDYCDTHAGYGTGRDRNRPHYTGDYQTRAKRVRDTATHCAICGGGPRKNDPWTAHHIIAGDPRSELVPAHKSCNESVGDQRPAGRDP